MNARLADLKNKARQIESEREQALTELYEIDSKRRAAQPLVGLTQVRGAFLPPQSSREQCALYLATLRDAVAQRKNIRSDHEIVQKLKAVPERHLDLLIDEHSSSTVLGTYVQFVLTEQHTAAIRARIAQSLEQYPHNIHLIVTHGWCQDIAPLIKRKILANALPDDKHTAKWWFHAAVELADPTLYKQLHEITVKAELWQHHILLLRSLPDYDLPHTLNVCLSQRGAALRNARPVHAIGGFNDAPSRVGEFNHEVLQLAAGSGHVDALESLVQSIPDTEKNPLRYRWSAAHPRMRALRFMAFRGSNAEIKAWFARHRDQLVFDELYQRFVLPEPLTKP